MKNRNTKWYTMDKKAIALVLIILVTLPLITGCVEEEIKNHKPLVTFSYPQDGIIVSQLVMISGMAFDPDGNDSLIRVEVRINDDEWSIADGTTKWSFDWRTYQIDDGMYTLYARSWDGEIYSDIEEITVYVENPKVIESDEHKWAVFVIAANFPEDNESKLGNGGLYLAEEIAEYLILSCGYSTSNIAILFDDGWIRDKNGYGNKTVTIQQRKHQYDYTYGGATEKNVFAVFDNLIEEANQFEDSEVFIWIASHGYGSFDDSLGGKLFEKSAIFLWDYLLTDKELGDILSDLNSKKTTIIVDACFGGGFADKTILNVPTFFTLRSGIPKSGRVVISGASKFRSGYASTTEGPLFTDIWFEGIKSGDADGFRPGLANIGRPTILSIFKDGKVSVEEAFYYARYIHRTAEELKDYNDSEPQINDKYPRSGFLFSRGGLFLNE